MAKRISKIIDDSKHEDLHNGKFGVFTAHKWSSDTFLTDGITTQVSPDLFEKLGKPKKVKVTISAVD